MTSLVRPDSNILIPRPDPLNAILERGAQFSVFANGVYESYVAKRIPANVTSGLDEMVDFGLTLARGMGAMSTRPNLKKGWPNTTEDFFRYLKDNNDQFELLLSAAITFIGNNVNVVRTYTQDPNIVNAIQQALASGVSDVVTAAVYLREMINTFEVNYPSVSNPVLSMKVVSSGDQHRDQARSSSALSFAPKAITNDETLFTHAASELVADASQNESSEILAFYEFTAADLAASKNIILKHAAEHEAKEFFLCALPFRTGVSGDTFPMFKLPQGRWFIKIYRHQGAVTGVNNVMVAGRDVLIPAPGVVLPPNSDGGPNFTVLSLPKKTVGDPDAYGAYCEVVDTSFVVNLLWKANADASMVVRIKRIADIATVAIDTLVGGQLGTPEIDRTFFRDLRVWLASHPRHHYFVSLDYIWQTVAQRHGSTFKLENGEQSMPQAPRDYALFSEDYKEQCTYPDMWFLPSHSSSSSIYPISPANMRLMYPHVYALWYSISREMNFSLTSSDYL